MREGAAAAAEFNVLKLRVLLRINAKNAGFAVFRDDGHGGHQGSGRAATGFKIDVGPGLVSKLISYIKT